MAELSESRNTARDAIVRPLSRAAERPCARPGCPSPSRATLDFSYATRIAHLRSLSEERSPQSYDLCANHADRTSPPSGWELRDERVDDEGEIAGDPAELDSPRTVAVLAAALRGEPQDPDAGIDADPLREALEELQAVSSPVDAPVAEPRPLVRAEPPSPAPSLEPTADDAPGAELDDLDLQALTDLLTEAESDEVSLPEPAQEQIELLTLALEDTVDDRPSATVGDPGRPVPAQQARSTDDQGRATLW